MLHLTENRVVPPLLVSGFSGKCRVIQLGDGVSIGITHADEPQ